MTWIFYTGAHMLTSSASMYKSRQIPYSQYLLLQQKSWTTIWQHYSKRITEEFQESHDYQNLPRCRKLREGFRRNNTAAIDGSDSVSEFNSLSQQMNSLSIPDSVELTPKMNCSMSENDLRIRIRHSPKQRTKNQIQSQHFLGDLSVRGRVTVPLGAPRRVLPPTGLTPLPAVHNPLDLQPFDLNSSIAKVSWSIGNCDVIFSIDLLTWSKMFSLP